MGAVRIVVSLLGLEWATRRRALIGRLARSSGRHPATCCPRWLFSQSQILPDFAGMELGMAERLAARAAASAAGVPVEQVLAGACDTGKLA